MALYQQLRNEEESVSINPPVYQQFSPGHGPPVPLQSFPPPQQQQSSNVVVVGQPNQVSQVQVREMPRANDNLMCSVLLFVVCILLGNWTVLICLFPALIFSIIASTYNDAGEYNLAKKFGRIACKCNIVATISTLIVVILMGIVITSLILVGLKIITL